MDVGVALITHRALKHLPSCLPPLLASSLKPKVLVVNSSSGDGTVETAEKLGASTLVVPRKEFNHGLTREKARMALGTEIVVMMTPDAYPISNDTLDKLVAPILEGKASLAYGRQIPHAGAGFWEAFPRAFNYGKESHFRSLKDKEKWGSYSFFFSDSFAAYNNKALEEAGGFSEALTGEDAVACAKLLLQGHTAAYVAEAVVRHSHHYSLKEEFKRHFDTGLARFSQKELLFFCGSDLRRGSAYASALFAAILKEKNYQWLPYAFFHLAAKWSGYQLGARCTKAPLFVKKLFSSQEYYWSY
jgi:rhamnosyltransferase